MSKEGARLFRTLGTISYVDVRLIKPSPFQLREQLGDLGELVESIKKNGLLQPIVVRPNDDYFEVVAGNRRLAACRRLRISKVLCLLKELSNKEACEISIIENIHRKTLNPIEEARAFKAYCDRLGYGSVSELANKIGKSEGYVSHRMLLLTLPKEVLRRVSSLELSPTLAEELVWVKDSQKQLAMAETAFRGGLSAKEVRSLVKVGRQSVGDAAGEKRKPAVDNWFTDISPEAEDSDVKAITEATLILRSALIHMDFLIERGVPHHLKHVLMAKRYALHQLLDELYSLRNDRVRTVRAFAR